MTDVNRQLEFILSADKLKAVTRQNSTHDWSRAENVAEHSWHLTLMALVLAEYAPAGTRMERVLELLVVHDLVEIYAGDTLITTAAEAEAVAALETAAAERVFATLPEA